MNAEELKAVDEMTSIVVAFGEAKTFELFILAIQSARVAMIPTLDDLMKGYRKL